MLHEVTIRPLIPADVPAWAGLLAAIEAVDRAGEHYGEDDLAEELADPGLDPARDSFAAWHGDDLRGYVLVVPRLGGADGADEPLVVLLDAGVHPDVRRQGLGGELTVRALRRAREQAAEHGRRRVDVRAGALLEAPDAERLLLGRGFEPFRFSFDMERDLSTATEVVPALPAGWRLDTYAPADEDDLLRAHNVAFAEYPGFAVWTPAEWRQRVSGSRNLAPDHTYVVRDHAGDVAAYLVGMEYDAHTAATGVRELYVAKLGSLPQHREQGLGTTLLRHAMARAAADGFGSAALDVDTHNPSGALGIYERAGFTVRQGRRSMRALLDLADE